MCLHQDSVPLLTYDVRKAGHTLPISELFLEAIEMLLEGEPARGFHYTSRFCRIVDKHAEASNDDANTVKEWLIKYHLAAYLPVCVPHP